MKKAVVIGIFLILLVNFSTLEGADLKEYQNQSLGVAFDYPYDLLIDKNYNSEDRFSIIFWDGESKLHPQIYFSEIRVSNNFEKFIEITRKNQEALGYRDKVKEKEYTISGKIPAIEFIKSSEEWGTSYFFIFPSQKSGKLLSFKYRTEETWDPDAKFTEHYGIMRDSLRISNE